MSNAKMVRIAKDKSLLKEYISAGTTDSRVVHLNDKDEFQIQLYNPYSYAVAARIALNGVVMSNELVIRPAERIWLDRYLDKAVKFKFETYEVDGDRETEKIIASNGVVRVDFYKEKPRKKNPIQIVSWGPFNSGNEKQRSLLNNATDADYCTNDAYYDSSFASMNANMATCNSASVLTTSCCDTVETGRVVEGSHSSQQFVDIDMDFELYPCNTETIKILPMSRKPITANDLTKQYCQNCGHKINDRYKFCPYCGESLKD